MKCCICDETERLYDCRECGRQVCIKHTHTIKSPNRDNFQWILCDDCHEERRKEMQKDLGIGW